ncbi:hypothetical protein FRC03_009043 [Tulasnella sp. 419]|nr:hypothetical protein FRC02_008896 [Tulasnella sp. 418]KAG8958524.1 hypothetical protein FRC03_009043 [Tulasnella sp. 419]
MADSKTSSENWVGRQFDRCLADTLVKAGIGFSVGVVASVVLFKRRQWPVTLATGFGTGFAVNDCDRAFNPTRIPGTKILVQENKPTSVPVPSP